MVYRISRVSFEKRISDFRLKYCKSKIPSELLKYLDLKLGWEELHYSLEPRDGLLSNDVNAIINKYDWPTKVYLIDEKHLCSVRWQSMRDESVVNQYALVNLKYNRVVGAATFVFRYDTVLDEFSVDERAYLMGHTMNDILIKKMRIKQLKVMFK